MTTLASPPKKYRNPFQRLMTNAVDNQGTAEAVGWHSFSCKAGEFESSPHFHCAQVQHSVLS